MDINYSNNTSNLINGSNPTDNGTNVPTTSNDTNESTSMTTPSNQSSSTTGIMEITMQAVQMTINALQPTTSVSLHVNLGLLSGQKMCDSDVLNDKNWIVWKGQMIILLGANQLRDHVLGDISAPDESNTNAYSMWKSTNQAVSYLILQKYHWSK
ncbi:hypothetical protein APHAL10511_002813 [Amanita phalloides]|nr:hypothetical protein APHAL10511_002813 [Amanita phalloides]